MYYAYLNLTAADEGWIMLRHYLFVGINLCAFAMLSRCHKNINCLADKGLPNSFIFLIKKLYENYLFLLINVIQFYICQLKITNIYNFSLNNN